MEILVTHEAGLQLRALVVEAAARQHPLFGSGGEHAGHLFPLDNIEKAGLAIRDQIACACETGSIWSAPMPIVLVWAWKRIGCNHRLAEWIIGVIADDAKVVQLGNELVEDGPVPLGNNGTRTVEVFNRATWEALLDVDEVFNRLEQLSPSVPEAETTLRRLQVAEKNYEPL
ncbi:MAG: hypothetical protein KGQ37_10750 [Hyphomicrobiales bacterium]|nr:hypothetical protein [Hyphomicrobiales bacterium]